MPNNPCKHGHMSLRYKKNRSCVECERLRARKWRKDNREDHNEYHVDYRKQSIRLLKKYLLDLNEMWFTKQSRKRHHLKQATPDWVDKDTLRSVYQECVEWSERMNMPFVVDHIIPLKNPKVCGLHVPENLKIVSESFKRKKGNKFIPSLLK